MKRVICLIAVLAGGSAFAQVHQTEQDEYTRYELLAPDSASFKIDYEVTATTAGATLFFNPIRKGSVASDEAVYDMATGAPLPFEQVSGSEARASGLLRADEAQDYLRVHLARPVPPDGGQARIRIIKTYKDAKSYHREGDAIVFSRPLGIRRNAVVLPAGYQITDCSVPSQVLSLADGRIEISFMHQAPGEAALVLKARPGAQLGDAAKPRPLTDRRSWEPPGPGPTERARLSERAHQDRDIVYFLEQPDTHAFRLYHDYSESRPGVGTYLNVVRTGSRVAEPHGRILDTGEPLKTDVMTGAQLRAANIDAQGEEIAPAQQVVVFRFPAPAKGQSVRLRMFETYTAPESYRLEGDAFVFERSFGRPRNSVVLPRGWYLTALSIPGVIRQTTDGLTRIDFVNGRPDAIDVLLKAKRAGESGSGIPRAAGGVTGGLIAPPLQALPDRVITLEPSPGTVAYGYYDAAATPAIRIRSGDTIRVHTLITSTPQRLTDNGVAPDQIEPALRDVVENVTGNAKGPGGHILTGPIFVEGAQPGDVLEVRIQKIDLAIPYAYNGFSPRGGLLRADFTESRTKIVALDRERMIGRFAEGIDIPLRPFFGSMGVAPPPAAGRVGSAPPGKHAGNLDNKELVAGSVLYIPVNVPGALFEVGDGHAAMGDGEVDITALETSLVGTLQFVVRKDMRLTWPRGETATDWITMGIDDDLAEATRIATREMIDFLVNEKKMSREEAYMLSSAAGNLAITQVVDGPAGVHMKMPKAIFTRHP